VFAHKKYTSGVKVDFCLIKAICEKRASRKVSWNKKVKKKTGNSQNMERKSQSKLFNAIKRNFKVLKNTSQQEA